MLLLTEILLLRMVAEFTSSSHRLSLLMEHLPTAAIVQATSPHYQIDFLIFRVNFTL